MSQFDSLAPWGLSPDCPTPVPLQSLSPVALAYLGDAVFEVYIRCRYLFPPRRIRDFHRCVVAQVRAEKQAQILGQLSPHLTPEEQEWVRRGRNAATVNARRADPDAYRAATGLETLVGYLYLSDRPRLEQLLNTITLPP